MPSFRIKIFCFFALFVATGAKAQGHYSDQLNYLTCTGEEYTLRWNGNGFQHTKRGGGSHDDVRALYQTWDGSCWELRWNGSKFEHYQGGAGGPMHTDDIVNYKTWGGGEWTATRKDNGFYHIMRGAQQPSNADPDSRVIWRGWMNLPPCSKLITDNGLVPYLKTADQEWHVEITGRFPNGNDAQSAIEDCGKVASAVCAVAAWYSGGTACVAAFESSFSACMTSRGKKVIENSIKLSTRSECKW